MKKKKRKSFVEKYNEKETKGNAQNTALKSTVDTIASSFIGTGLGAISGKFSPLVGIATIVAGHYLGDKSGVLRITGASTLGYGIAKAKEYNENPDYDSPEKRLKGLGNDLLAAAHIKWKKEQEQDENKPKKKIVSKSEPKVVEESVEKESAELENDDADLGELEDQLKNGMEMAEEYVNARKLNQESEEEENQEEREIDPFDDPETDLSLI